MNKNTCSSIVSGIAAFLLSCAVSDAAMGEQLGTAVVPEPRNDASFYYKHPLFLMRRLRAIARAATMAIVPAPLIDTSPSFFSGTGDGSAGAGWTTRP